MTYGWYKGGWLISAGFNEPPVIVQLFLRAECHSDNGFLNIFPRPKLAKKENLSI